MSCSTCYNTGVTDNCTPCQSCAQADPNNEPLQSALDNFVASFYGMVTKTLVDGKVVWTLPCNLDVGFPNNPRKAGEGLACYFLRLFEEGITGLTGPRGLQGESGDEGANAYTTLVASFTQPDATCTTIGIRVLDPNLFAADAYVYLVGSGYYRVLTVSGDTMYLTIVSASAAVGTVFPVGTRVYVSGPVGAQGATGQGTKGDPGPQGPAGPTGSIGPSAQTTVSTAFTMPALYADTVPLSLADASGVEEYQTVYVTEAGYFRVVSVSGNIVVLKNLYGTPTNAAPGTAFGSGKIFLITGGEGLPAFAQTTANFTMPAVAAPVSVSMNQTAFIQAGNYVLVGITELMLVSSVTDHETAVLVNTGAASNSPPTTVVTSGSKVTVSGPPVSKVEPITTLAIDTTLNKDNYTHVMVDTTAGDVTLTLPTATSAEGHVFNIKKVDGANDVIVDGNGAETIDGAADQTITTQYDNMAIVSDGTEWFIL